MSSGSDSNISVILITHNEEENIDECLKSVSWAGEIIVVDSMSTDRTVEIASKYTEKIFVKEWLGYAGAKNFALGKASKEWVLWVDADERIGAGLATEIHDITVKNSADFAGYEVARRAYFLGKWIKHSGWYPGYVVRLFRRNEVHFDDAQVHERIKVAGKIGRLANDMIHLTDLTLFHYFHKFNRYTTLAVEDLRKNGRKFSLFDVTVRPAFFFIKMYLIRLGFLDGTRGLILAALSASYVFVKYAKLRERGGK